MSTPPRLNNPKMRVIIGQPDDDSTWRELEVQSLHIDNLMTERNWPKIFPHLDIQKTPITAGTMIAYQALVRSGQVDGTFADFEAGVLAIDDVEAEPVDPTRPDLGTD